MANKKTRACHLLVTRLLRAKAKDGFVPRQTLINTLLRSRYASTAESKLSGYMNDIRVYEKGILEVKQAEHSRLLQAYRLVNADEFDPKTGMNVKLLAERDTDDSSNADEDGERKAA